MEVAVSEADKNVVDGAETAADPEEAAVVVQAITPTKTPMYQAVHAARYQRQQLIKEICNNTGNQLLCYVAGIAAPISRDDTLGIVELLHNVVGKNNNIDFLLHTAGGDIDEAEKIVSLLRARVGKGRLRVIIPDFAKSAGTLIAVAADAIVMSDSSEMGPIDPQVVRSDGGWEQAMDFGF